jgi:hypothetical protein
MRRFSGGLTEAFVGDRVSVLFNQLGSWMSSEAMSGFIITDSLA